MRTLPVNKVMSYLASSLVTTGLFVSTTTLAIPLQGQSTLSTTAKPMKETMSPIKTGSSNQNSVLVRHTTPKTESVNTTAQAQKEQDKKTVSRCWKRLMTMIREVSHAHHTKTK